MEDRLSDLYTLADKELSPQIYLQDLSEQCANMEQKVRKIMEKLSRSDRLVLQGYIDLRDELEYQSVKVAMKLSKGK